MRTNASYRHRAIKVSNYAIIACAQAKGPHCGKHASRKIFTLAASRELFF